MILTEPLRAHRAHRGLRHRRHHLRRWPHRPGRCAAPRHRPGAHRARSRAARRPQAGRVPHARRSREGVQEVRPQEGPQGSAVLEALARAASHVPALGIAVVAVRRSSGPTACGVSRTSTSRRSSSSRWVAPRLGCWAASSSWSGGTRAGRGRCSRRRLIAGLAAEGRAGRDARRGAHPGGGVAGGRRGRRRRGDLRVAQPVRGQRHQAVRARWPQAHRRRRDARSRPSSHALLRAMSEPARRRTGDAVGTVVDGSERGRPLGRLGAAIDRRPRCSTGCRWWSTAPTARPPTSRPRCCGRSERRSRCSTTSPTAPTSTTAAARPTRRTCRRRWSSAAPTLGLAFDGDADRVLAVDADGRLIDGDQIIAICAIDRHDRGRLADDTVVVTVMTNLGFRLGMARARHRGRSRCRSATGTCSRRWPTRACRSAASRAVTSSSPTSRPPVTACSPRCSCSTWCTAPGEPLGELADAAMTRLPQVLHNVRVADKGDGRRRVARRRDRGGRGRARRPRAGARPRERHRAARAGDGRGPHRARRPRRRPLGWWPPSRPSGRDLSRRPVGFGCGVRHHRPPARARRPASIVPPLDVLDPLSAVQRALDDADRRRRPPEAAAGAARGARRAAAGHRRRRPARPRPRRRRPARQPSAPRSATGSAPPRRSSTPTVRRPGTTLEDANAALLRLKDALWAVVRDRLPHRRRACASWSGPSRRGRPSRSARRSSRRSPPSTASRCAAATRPGSPCSCATTASTSADPAVARLVAGRAGDHLFRSERGAHARGPPQLRLQGGRRDRRARRQHRRHARPTCWPTTCCAWRSPGDAAAASVLGHTRWASIGIISPAQRPPGRQPRGRRRRPARTSPPRSTATSTTSPT